MNLRNNIRKKILIAFFPFMFAFMVDLILQAIVIYQIIEVPFQTNSSIDPMAALGTSLFPLGTALYFYLIRPFVFMAVAVIVILLEIAFLLVDKNGGHDKNESKYFWNCGHCDKEFKTKIKADEHEKRCEKKGRK